MIRCRRVALGEVASIRGGKRLPAGKDFATAKTAHPYIRARDIGGGKIEIHEPVFLDESTAQKLARYTVNKGDVCLTIVGANVGEMGIVPPHLDGANLTENAVKIVTNGKVDQQFLKYALFSEDAMAQMKVLAGGAAQPKLGIYKIETIQVPCPALPVQRRIADILLGYDALVENSQRRIRILETMARALYREWFVHFRFPGHENHPRVASPRGDIPEGWEMDSLGSLIVDHIGGGWGKDVPDDDHTEPAWVIRGTDIPGARGSQVTGVPHRYHTPSNIRSRKLSAGDILFEVSGGSKGQPVGRTLLITPGLLSAFDGNVICASFCKRVRPDADKYGAELLYLSFLEGYESGEIEQFQVQSTGISNFKWMEYIAQTERIIPPRQLRARFHEQVAPLFTQIVTLGLRIENLRRTRDLLLPRLLSGQVRLDIEDAEAPIGQADETAQLAMTDTLREARLNGSARSSASALDETDLPLATEPPASGVVQRSLSIDTTDRSDVLCAVRKIFSDGVTRDREIAIRDLARELGYERTGSRIRGVLGTDLQTAVRRGILASDTEGYRLTFRTLAGCERGVLKDAFVAAIGRAWIERDNAIRQFARWLGFARVGSIVDEMARSLINGLIREARLEADGGAIRRK